MIARESATQSAANAGPNQAPESCPVAAANISDMGTAPAPVPPPITGSA